MAVTEPTRKLSAHRLHRLPRLGSGGSPVPVKPATPMAPPLEGDGYTVTSHRIPRARGEAVRDQILAIDSNQERLNAQLKTIQTLIGRLEETHVELGANLEQKKRELAALESQGIILGAVRDKYQQEIAKDEASLAELGQRLEQLRAERSRLESGGAALASLHRTNFDRASNAQNYLSYLASLDPQRVSETAVAKAQREANSPEAAEARRRLGGTEAAIGVNNAAQKNLATAQGKVEVDVAATRATILEEQAALAVAQKELADVSSKSQELVVKTQEQRALLEANERALKAASSRVSAIQAEMVNLTARRKELIDGAIDGNLKDIGRIAKELEVLDRSEALLNANFKEAEAYLSEIQAHREILEAGRKALEGDMADLHARLQVLFTTAGFQRKDLDGALANLKSAESDISAANQRDQLLIRHGNGISDERYKLLEEQKALDHLATLPPYLLSEADRKRLASRKDLGQKIEDLSQKIADSNQRRAELAKQLGKLNSVILDATRQIAGARAKLAQIEVDISEGRSAQAETVEELRRTESNLVEAAGVIERAMANQQAIRRAIGRLDTEQEALKSKRSELEKDNQGLNLLKK